MKVRVSFNNGEIEEIYSDSDFNKALESFCDKHGWENAEEVTVTEVGGFYDKNRTTHGGYRPGAGKKKTVPEDAKKRALMMTDKDHEQVVSLLENLREEAKP